MKPQQGKSAHLKHMIERLIEQDVRPLILIHGKTTQQRPIEDQLKRYVDVGIMGQSAHTIIMDEGDETHD